MKKFRWVPLFLVSLPLIFCLPSLAKTPPEIEQHIVRITGHLPPNMVKEGDTSSGRTLTEAMAEYHVSAVSIAVIHHGKLEWSRGFGTTSLGGSPTTPETLFQAGSVSKPLTAMAALRLVQEGNLGLDRDVNKDLTSWKVPASAEAGGKPVTLRELLTHTAGMTVHGFPGYAVGEPIPTLLQVLNGEKPASNSPIRVESMPGSKWNYSGGGYIVLQQLVQDASGKAFPLFLKETVLQPLGMTHSTYEQPLPASMREQIAVPLNRDGTPLAGGPYTYPELAAAGLWTTAPDLAKFLITMQRSLARDGNDILNAEMARQMVTPGLGDWGLGLSIGGTEGHRYFWHGGSNEGYECLMTAYENGEGAVVMTNASGGLRLANEVMRGIATEYGWADWRPRVVKVVAVDPKILAKYVGTYAIDPNFNLVMTFENGKLYCQGTGQKKFEMWSESETRFTFVVDVDVVFVTDAKGNVVGLDVIQDGRTRRAPKIE